MRSTTGEVQRRKRLPGPEARGRTMRAEMRDALRDGPLTFRDLSQRLGIREREVPAHLAHLARSLRACGECLVVEPAACLECGFRFEHRERFARPGRCPRCRAERISAPRFRIGRPGAFR